MKISKHKSSHFNMAKHCPYQLDDAIGYKKVLVNNENIKKSLILFS